MTYNEGLKKLRSLGLNIPEVICAFPIAEDDEKANTYKAVIDGMINNMKRSPYNVVIRYSSELPKNLVYTPISTLEIIMKDFQPKESAITLFKAPKTEPMLKGICIPGPYHLTFVDVKDMSRKYHAGKVIWGHPVDELPLPSAIRKPVNLLNDVLASRRLQLDGVHLEFTYHALAEGEMQHPIVFWGMQSPAYGS